MILNKIRYGRFLDIFVAHAAPYGIGDGPDPCHRGLKAFNLIIKWFKPSYFLHGHIHLYDRNENRVKVEGRTRVINCSGYYRLAINQEELQVNKE
jgi:Icc-related predicted phosphoesterase